MKFNLQGSMLGFYSIFAIILKKKYNSISILISENNCYKPIHLEMHIIQNNQIYILYHFNDFND